MRKVWADRLFELLDCQRRGLCDFNDFVIMLQAEVCQFLGAEMTCELLCAGLQDPELSREEITETIDWAKYGNGSLKETLNR